MTTRLRPADGPLTNWSHRTTALLLTATVLLGSLSVTATALGDPELVAALALVGCALALLGVGLSAVSQRRPVRSPPTRT